MTKSDSSDSSSFLRLLHSRRRLLKTMGGGAALASLAGSSWIRSTRAQTDATDSDISAYYDSAAVMPHMYAEIVFPFVRRQWEMNGRGTFYFDFDTAVTQGAVQPADAELLGSPTALYGASIIRPEGESWSTSRYLVIYNYPSVEEAAATAGRYAGAGVPATGIDLSASLDPSLGQAISYSIATDLQGTPAEQIFVIFAAGPWLFHYYSLTPQVSAAALPGALGQALDHLPAAGFSGSISPIAPRASIRSVSGQRAIVPSRTAQVTGEEIAGEAVDLSLAALIWENPEFIREMLAEKFGEEDEEIQTAVGEGYDIRFQGSQGNQSDYVKHTNRMYNQFGASQEEKQLNERYYDGPMCVHASNGQIPGTDVIFYSTTQYFDTAAAAQSHMQSIPTPAQEEVHAANGLIFQQDEDASDTDIIRSYLHWQPPDGTAMLPGYGEWERNNQVIKTYNIYQIGGIAEPPTGVDPTIPTYQQLKNGVLDIHEQKAIAEPGLSGWPEYDIPAVIL